MKLLGSILALLLLIAPSVSQAEMIEEKDLLSGKQKLDPASGYVLVSTPSEFHGTLLQVPDADDWALYRKAWENELAAAKKEYPAKLAAWQKQADIAVMSGRKPWPRPVEPTEKTVSIGPIERWMRTPIGLFAFNKDKKVPIYRYLAAVKPGTYIWYGPMIDGIAFGTPDLCYCMGSVKFEVKAGVITDLGDSLVSVTRHDGLTGNDKIDAAGGGFSSAPDGKGEPGLEAARYGAPASLSALPVVRTEFHASGKIDNSFNGVVSRVRPIPGIIGYDRDTVIDLRTGRRLPAELAAFDPDASGSEQDKESGPAD